MGSNLQEPKYLVLLASCTYEIILLAAWLFCTILACTYIGINNHVMLQLINLISAAIYFMIPWSKNGQTLAMKAWNLKIISSSEKLNKKIIGLRYLINLILWVLIPIINFSVSKYLFGISDSSAMYLVILNIILLLVYPLFNNNNMLTDKILGTKILRHT